MTSSTKGKIRKGYHQTEKSQEQLCACGVHVCARLLLGALFPACGEFQEGLFSCLGVESSHQRPSYQIFPNLSLQT